MKKVFGASFTFVGTVIGAGFATGQEINLFFGNCSVFSVLLAGILLGGFCYLFLKAGMLTKGKVLFYFGKFSPIIGGIVVIANLAVFCTTLAGSERVFYNLFGIRCGSIITAVLTLIIVIFGLKQIKIVNTLIVPVIIALVLVIFFRDKSPISTDGKFSVAQPFCYASMNVITGGFVVSEISSDFTEKQCVLSGLLTGLCLTATLLAIYFPVKNVSEEMPLIVKATLLDLKVVGNVVLYLAMLTTLIGTLQATAKNSVYKKILFSALGLLVSSVGFAELIDKMYPVLGAIGGAVCIAFVIVYFAGNRSSRYCNPQCL